MGKKKKKHALKWRKRRQPITGDDAHADEEHYVILAGCSELTVSAYDGSWLCTFGSQERELDATTAAEAKREAIKAVIEDLALVLEELQR